VTRRRSVGPAAWLGVVVATFTVLVLSTKGPPPPTPNPPGTFAFGALGDAPYYPWEDWRYPLVLQDMDGNDLAFSIHVGDIFWYPCSDERYERSLRWFNGLQRPLIYVPGDNEWADCWTEQEGGFNPRDRLARLRQTLYARPEVSLSTGDFGRASTIDRQALGTGKPIERARSFCALAASTQGF
jgi:hypothetical protein